MSTEPFLQNDAVPVIRHIFFSESKLPRSQIVQVVSDAFFLIGIGNPVQEIHILFLRHLILHRIKSGIARRIQIRHHPSVQYSPVCRRSHNMHLYLIVRIYIKSRVAFLGNERIRRNPVPQVIRPVRNIHHFYRPYGNLYFPLTDILYRYIIIQIQIPLLEIPFQRHPGNVQIPVSGCTPE